MKRLSLSEMIEHCKKYPNGGVLFCEGAYDCDGYLPDGAMITLGADFFALDLLPDHRTGEENIWDWSLLADYDDSDFFYVFDEKDIREMIKRLNLCLTNSGVYDEEEVHHNCLVQIWRNSETGEESIGWKPEESNEEPM